MKFEVSTDYLDPISLGEYEHVGVVLPDGRMVTVFSDKIYIRSEEDQRRRRDGKLIWTAMSSRSRQYPYGKVRQPSGGEDGGELSEPPSRQPVPPGV